MKTIELNKDTIESIKRELYRSLGANEREYKIKNTQYLERRIEDIQLLLESIQRQEYDNKE